MKRALIHCLLALLAGPSIGPAAAQSAAAPPSARVTVSQFTVSGNTLLPAARIDAALAPFRGERTLAELRQAVEAVQALYREAGWGAVVAYLPEQSLASGNVAIAVLEGRVQQIVVTGQQHTSPDAARRALPALQEGRTPQVRELDRQIQLANENPARQLAVVMEPGKASGEVDARITVADRPLSSWSIAVDNTGTSQTGNVRTTVGWRHASLWGRDHVLNLQYQTSLDKPSQVSIVSANYSVPLPAQAMRLDVYAARSDVDGGTTATAVGALQFVGKGNVLGARLTQLYRRAGEFDRRSAVAIDRREYQNDCSIAGLAPGACGAAGESVAVTPLSIEFAMQRAGELPLGLNATLTRNLELGGRFSSAANFEAVRAGAKPGYTSLRVSAFANPALARGWRLQTRLTGQLTPDALVPGEQFGLAGANVVRGYAEREVIGDSAWVANVEALSPEYALGSSGRVPWRWLAFADVGRVSNHRDAECLPGRSQCTLGAVGVGLRAGPGTWQLRADLAVPLKDGNRTDRHSAKLHVAASVAFE